MQFDNQRLVSAILSELTFNVMIKIIRKMWWTFLGQKIPLKIACIVCKTKTTKTIQISVQFKEHDTEMKKKKMENR